MLSWFVVNIRSFYIFQTSVNPFENFIYTHFLQQNGVFKQAES